MSASHRKAQPLLPGASTQLDNLAKLMNDYPLARIELLAHTDDAGTVREQSIVTRARLKTLALYLIHDKGISANRVALRSLGGIRPLYENTTARGVGATTVSRSRRTRQGDDHRAGPSQTDSAR